MLRQLLTLIFLFPFSCFSLLALSLENKVQREISLLNLPASPWRGSDDKVCDVAIIGGGQAGCAIAYALELEGIYNVKIFEGQAPGKEGPWLTTARMRTLRSGKVLRAVALGIPHLTFRAYYEAHYGKKAWEKLGKIPTKLWGRYLQWVRKALGLSIHNGWTLQKIIPNADLTLSLHFDGNRVVQARKIVLATGRGGFGGNEIPDFIKSLPHKFWAHTDDPIDPEMFQHKRVTVIGVGASGFDAAATALEHGAKRVQMLMRRATLPDQNLFSPFAYPGFQYGFYYLSDKERHDYFSKALEIGIPPPKESIKRLDPFSTFELVPSTQIHSMSKVNREVHIETNHGTLKTDFVVVATGYAVDGSRCSELHGFYDKILLWKDRLSHITAKMGRYPYLGPYFEFQEKEPGAAPYLANIHCFNDGGFLSHGRICGELDCIDVGIKRLVEGICIGLFLQETRQYGEPLPYDCPGTCQSGLCSPSGFGR